MKLSDAKFCLECDEVFLKARSGKCPACSSFSVEPVSYFVPEAREEREELIDAATVRVISEPWWWRLPVIGRYFRPFDIAY